MVTAIFTLEALLIRKLLNTLQYSIRDRLKAIDVWLALRSAGWSDSYRIDASTLELPSGLELHDAAREFLERYGGLEINVRGRTTILPNACDDDLVHVLQMRETEGVAYYPVGRIDDECATCILIDETGILHLYIVPPGADSPPWPICNFNAVIRYAMG